MSAAKGGGVWIMLTLADKGGRGVETNAEIRFFNRSSKERDV